MPITEAQRKAHDKYFSKAYKQVKLSMPKQEADDLEQYCNEHNLTKAGFIREAIKEKMGRDNEAFDRYFPTDLQTAIRLVSNLTGENEHQLVLRNVQQNLHHDLEYISMGVFPCKSYPDKGTKEVISKVILDATGIAADEFILKDDEPIDDETRAYVLRESQDRFILMPVVSNANTTKPGQEG